MENKKVIMKVENLSKEFVIHGKKLMEPKKMLHALSDVSFEIYEGETLGIIGESGCGKSTLGRCLVQLHKPTSGTILYEGEDLWKMTGEKRKETRRNIQMIFQDPYSSLDPRHTAADSVEEPMIVHKTPATARERQERTIGLFKEVGLDMQHLNRYPHEFSGGQRQRLNIARAIASNPRVVICDEPVSALDVSIQAQVINLFKKLQKHFNLTYIFISHDLSVVKYISDRIAIMYLGRLVELCDSDSIYHNPLHPYTQALLSAIPPESPEEEKERIVLTGEVPSPIGEQKGCPLANRCPRCMKRCREELPKLLPHGDTDHMVACFLYQNERD
mgnify:CR=1 FL=1